MDPGPDGSLIRVALFFIVPTAISFFCSLLEAVLLSTSSSHLAVNAKKGSRAAIRLQKMKKEIDRPLAAILTFNTIAQTAGAAGMGAEILRVFGNEYVAAASGVMTFMILVFAELIPKKIGVVHWRRLYPIAAYAITVLTVVSYPLVLISQAISSFLTHTKRATTEIITREEVMETVEAGASTGNLAQKESFLIKNVLSLQKVLVTDIMTPRNEMYAVDSQLTVGQLMKNDRELRYSRLPVYSEKLDNIIGVVHRYLILEAYSQDRDALSIKSLMKPISRISHKLSVAQVLDLFIQRREHIFVVESAQRRIIGLVTFDDAMETLLGSEIGDRYDSTSDLRRSAIQAWQRYRVLPTDHVKNYQPQM